jgi:hypothetical protein
MSTLQATLQSIAADFSKQIIQALRGASLDDLAAVSAGGRQTASKKSNGVSPIAKKSGRLGRRSMDDIQRALDRIVVLLTSHPEGLRAEQIREQLGLDRRELPRPIEMGLSRGALSKSGQKRATVYTLGGQTGKKKAAKKKSKK